MHRVKSWFPSLLSPAPMSPTWRKAPECPFRNILCVLNHNFYTHGVYYPFALYIYHITMDTGEFSVSAYIAMYSPL